MTSTRPTHRTTSDDTLRPSEPSRPRAWRDAANVQRVGAVYVLVLIVVVFSIWLPDSYPTWATVRQIANGNAITAMAALALVVPLACRTFDLSFAYTMTLSGCVTAYLITALDLPPLVAGLAGLVAALAMGVINGVVVVVMRIDSFIGTLATGSLVQAFITYFTGDTSITDVRLSTGFAELAQSDVGGFVTPVLYAAVIAVVLWVLLEHTPLGRRIYAAGFNPDAARLASIRVDRLRFGSLLTSAVIAGFAGICLSSSLGAGSPSAGTAYLLPGFAAAFLGATQLKGGRFNAWGTIIAVVLLGAGTVGLGLAAAPPWSTKMFTGVVLICALAVTGLQHRSRVRAKSV